MHCLSKVVNKPDEQIVVFYGGTALNRTYLEDFRLSEDIDLIVESSPEWIEQMKSELLALIVVEFKDALWVSESVHDGVWTGYLGCTQDIEIQIQCVKPRARWEYYLPHLSTTHVQLRYSDLPDSVEFLVPNTDAFVAMKLCAWIDRYAPRDLADLGELAQHGFVTSAALEIARNIFGAPFTAATLGKTFPPKVERDWDTSLTHQAATMFTAQECFAELINAVQKIEDPN